MLFTRRDASENFRQLPEGAQRIAGQIVQRFGTLGRPVFASGGHAMHASRSSALNSLDDQEDHSLCIMDMHSADPQRIDLHVSWCESSDAHLRLLGRRLSQQPQAFRYTKMSFENYPLRYPLRYIEPSVEPPELRLGICKRCRTMSLRCVTSVGGRQIYPSICFGTSSALEVIE